MRSLHRDALSWLSPRVTRIARADAPPPADGSGGTGKGKTQLASEFTAHVESMVGALAPRVATPFDRLAGALEKNNSKAMRSIGLDVRGQLAPHIDDFREWNQSLIKNAARDFISDVAGVLDDPKTWGLRHEEISALLQQRANVSESRAKLIARDQTSKLNSNINSFRQKNAGVASYEWSTSLDERVRDTHVANEGKEFAWGSPPVETGDPGDDVNCRCIAIPIIPELDDEDDDALAAGDDDNSSSAGGAAGSGGDEPPEPPDGTVAAPDEEPEEPRIEEGIHADVIDIVRGADKDLAEHALTSQPPGVLDALASNKVDALRFVSREPSARNAPGQWSARGNASAIRTEIQINTRVQPLAILRANADKTMSTKLAMRAAEAVKGNASRAAVARAAEKAKIIGTTTHEIGHQIHMPLRPDLADATSRRIDARARTTFAASRRDGTAAKISEYATADHIEFFAEAFSAYHHAPELLDSKIRDMVSFAIQARKKP